MTIDECIARELKESERLGNKKTTDKEFWSNAVGTCINMNKYGMCIAESKMHKQLAEWLEELKRWRTEKININIENPFANVSTLICHNCDHKDEYIMELEEELKQLRNHQNEVCEWKDSYLSGSEYKRNPHNKIAMSGKYLIENNMLYCPCCGKKIKFINATTEGEQE